MKENQVVSFISSKDRRNVSVAPADSRGEDEFFILPTQATVDYVSFDKESPSWLLAAGVVGKTTVSPHIVRVNPAHRHPSLNFIVEERVTNLTDWPPSGGLDGFFYEDGSVSPDNYVELVDYARTLGWIITPALEAMLATAKSHP